MPKPKKGDTVSVHYTGKLEDGEIFDSSKDRGPLEAILGMGQLIEGFEKALYDMEVGEQKTIHIPKEQAYGEYNPALVVAVSSDKLPEGFAPQVGEWLQMTTDTGHDVIAKILEVNPDGIKLDANHRLAGKDLVFDLELLEIL
ncbi:MAG: peptidylprolyl isomerase [Candidatus Magasanikbacteria bacterium CG11_big_fil_rev_8_21_14_0_20_39_34]|uniref:Peptidyl-prolyl cis-trans isomerase n=1 Tax=Candidatus Magasanikbacteria bacterium CG11_big_fil_rev_8_21_14_0_20_39_34 TaxID=1974653 RepID=A0A2H0N8D5_9BACT|nr:MAG: peptidylprolyl isomerase [Candidatus Magasanikbacteria bacterium CG11_big_fil_rev_8_21_14_0_20_39_34]